MKWVLASQQQDAVHLFHLIESSSIKETLRYYPAQQSVRVSCHGRQRLFFLEQAGFRSNHFVFKNEYGFVIGKFTFDLRNNSGGMIEIEGRKIHYSFINKTQPEFSIYNENSLQPMATCKLSGPNENNHAIALNNKEIIHEYACLLLGLCWYLCKPLNIEEDAHDFSSNLAFA